MEKKDFDKLRFITQMNEMVHVIKTSPYQSQKDGAKKTLDAIQEQYKTRFGEYSADHIIKEEEKRKYAEKSIDELIEILEGLKKKHGGETPVQVHGTLMCGKDGNSVLMTTEQQM